MLYNMETASIQTAFRLKPGLIARLKREAQRQGKSVNALVTEILDRETRLEWPTLPKDYSATAEDLFTTKGHIPSPTEEMLKANPKLAYIWKKGA